MPFRDQYQAQVRLLVRLLPVVAREACFALKVGTAINLFTPISFPKVSQFEKKTRGSRGYRRSQSTYFFAVALSLSECL